MRLVCENCSASYTIEDELVGDRDFRVSCKQCGTPIVVKQGRADTPPPLFGQQTTGPQSSSRLLSPRPPRPPASFAPTGNEEWFAWIEGAQRGPYQANQVAELIERGEMDWATQVWREGFRDWRVARRDATLVTAVAGASGAAGDTMRLNAARSFLAPEDTIVEARPDVLAAMGSQRISAVPSGELLQSASDTQAIDARDLPEVLREKREPTPPPQQWNTPENAAFRAGLGLPPDTQQSRPRSGSGRAPASVSAPTLADAFRAAPSLMRTGPLGDTTADQEQAEQGEPEGWMPKPQSLFAVAAIAFAGGVLVAAIASRFIAKPEEPPTQVTAEQVPSASSTPEPPQKPAVEPLPSTAPAARPPEPVTTPPIVAPARELPEPDELRREVRRVAPQVKRCIIDPKQGVEVALFIDGPSGRVRDVNVRSEGLAPGRVDCVIHAVRQIELAPFAREELKLEHRFSW